MPRPIAECKRGVRQASYWRSPWTLLGASALLGWAILGVGFRFSYDDVIPEVVMLVLSGFALGMLNRAARAGIALLGLVMGIVLSEILFPVPAPAAHIARYGPPPLPSVRDWLLVSGFPAVGTVMGMLGRKLA